MLRRLRGKVIEKGKEHLIVDVCGFGIEVLVDLETAESASEEVELFTKLVSGDEPKVYGFSSRDKLTLFEKLISVSKVGPRTALRVISSAGAEEIVVMIRSGDVSSLAALPGIGKKTAERIVAELRDSLEDFEGIKVAGIGEAIEALVALGFPRSDASRAVRAVAMEGDGVEELVKKALRELRKG